MSIEHVDTNGTSNGTNHNGQHHSNGSTQERSNGDAQSGLANGDANKAEDARHLIEVRDTPDAGLGVFALGRIPRGTRILCEPLLLALNGGEDPREILNVFSKLCSADKARYMQLHPFAPPVRKDKVRQYMKKKWDQLDDWERKVIGIYDANSFEVGVFHLPSRINHSCIPNVHYEFNPEIERGTFHAVSDIEAGAELLISYINGGNRTKAWRQPKLDQWGFVCQCAACGDDEEGKKREARRKEMYDLDQKLAVQSAYGTQMTPMQALKTATKLASLQIAEGIANRELRVSYHDAARYSLEIKNAKMALLWAEKERDHERICLGEDHPVFKAVSARVGLLKDIAEGRVQFDKSFLEYFE
ncbi:SET domain-containing protein [Corynespora cassiicola Philippines]|uniref:SET domain-containing protein n=1 Tax=Corynespora cassiicola Philippines TaxID=1448308 RepID=A0A2T2NRY5_CORCC|nr:SET domain-containing protein [Corynespora cassiicola Philippines]